MHPLFRFLLLGLLLTPRGIAGSAFAPGAPVHDTAPLTYDEEDVTIDTGPVTLAGALLTPVSNTAVPAVVLLPGSGPATRNGSWQMYRRIGEFLAGHGIAVLLYDKRGVGSSTGNWKAETFEARADDAAALVAYLRGRPEIDPDRIGLVGHSQGAYIAPLVAANNPGKVRFVVLLAGSAQRVWDQVLTNQRFELQGNGVLTTDVERGVASLENQLRWLDRVQAPCRLLRLHYLCFVLDYDPTAALTRLTVPTLALYAELDTQVPPAINIPLVEAALQNAGNTQHTIRTFAQANHWFAPAETGTTLEMRELAQKGNYEFVAGFLETMESWITAQTERSE